MFTRSLVRTISRQTTKCGINASVVRRSIGSLVIGELDGNVLSKNTLNAIQVAKEFGEIFLWLCEVGITDVICKEAVKDTPVKEVLFTDVKDLSAKLPENRCRSLNELCKSHPFDFICGCSSSPICSLLARFAASNDLPMLSDVINVLDKDTFQRFVYAGNAVETVQLVSSPKVMTIRPSAHNSPSLQPCSPPAIHPLPVAVDPRYSKVVKESRIQSGRPSLSTASRVVVGGRGVGRKEQFQEIFDLADKIGGAVGGTRAAVDMGMLESSLQVGQTGKVIRPSLYIGCGVSGSIQHQAGMKESQTIVCINKDPEAPLFKISDYGIVGDMHQIIPEMLSKL